MQIATKDSRVAADNGTCHLKEIDPPIWKFNPGWANVNGKNANTKNEQPQF